MEQSDLKKFYYEIHRTYAKYKKSESVSELVGLRNNLLAFQKEILRAVEEFPDPNPLKEGFNKKNREKLEDQFGILVHLAKKSEEYLEDVEKQLKKVQKKTQKKITV